MKCEHRLAPAGRRRGGRQGYPHCCAKSPAKIQFIFRFSFTAPLATSATAGTGCSQFHFQLWQTGVDTWPPVNHVILPFIDVSRTPQNTHPFNQFKQAIHHPSIHDSINYHTRHMSWLLYILAFVFPVVVYIFFTFSQRLSITFGCTVRAPVIVYQ